MIIIPDTHGLDFWKDAVSTRQDNEKIIFGNSALSNPIITETFAALDCGKAFRLDETRGVITPL